MWIQYLLSYILELVLFPGYVGSLIWLFVGSIIFLDGYTGIQGTGGINSQLTEAICNIDARKEVITPPDIDSKCYLSNDKKIPCPSRSCVKIDVSYPVGNQTYSGPAYSFPLVDTCFGDQAFEVNNQYYCWYLTKNPGVVYLNKVDTLQHRSNIFYGSVILFLASMRLLYLLFKKSSKSEGQNSYQLRSITQFVKDESIFVVIGIISGMTAIGSLIFYGIFLFIVGICLILTSVNASINGQEYITTTCTIKEIQAEKNKFRLKVSYPVNKLSYTVWSKYRVNSEYKIGDTILCWYESSKPQQVTFNPGVSRDNDSYYAGIKFIIIGGAVLAAILVLTMLVNVIISKLSL